MDSKYHLFWVKIFQSEKKSILIATNTTTSEEIIETNEIKDGGSANKTGEIDIPSFREWTKKALGKVSKEISIVTIVVIGYFKHKFHLVSSKNHEKKSTLTQI